MALIKCKHCGHAVSNKAKVCPKCQMHLQEKRTSVNEDSRTTADTERLDLEDIDTSISENSEKNLKKISIISYTIISLLILGIFIGFWIKWNNMG